MRLQCEERDDRRRDVLDKEEKDVNGIDYVEATKTNDDQFHVTLHLFHELVGKFVPTLKEKNIYVHDVRRNSEVPVELLKEPQLRRASALNNGDRKIEIRLTKNVQAGRTYRLSLVELENDSRTHYALTGFDPRHSEAEFVFYENRPATLVDPLEQVEPKTPVRPEPEINYLAKDYQSFKKLVLDRLAKIMPQWQGRHAADVGMTLVELLAYTGDQLSYFQDAVATEAYLETARQRISIRRHAKLVDYQIHEGANALSLVQLQTAADIGPLRPDQFYFITNPPPGYQLEGAVLNHFDLPEELFQQVEVFEPIAETTTDWRLKVEDFKDDIGFAKRLAASGDQLSRHIFQEMKTEVSGQIYTVYHMNANRLSESTLTGLKNELNRICEDDDLAFHALKEKENRHVIQQLKSEHHCSTRPKLNRAVLDLVYQQELSRLPCNTIKCIAAHNKIHFYTWGEDECWLAKGATSATLEDKWIPVSENCESKSAADDPNERQLSMLSAGEILLLEEFKGPKTGNPADADPHHRQAVRLVQVKHGHDPVTDTPVVEIRWRDEDALKFPICLSSRTNPSEFEANQSCRSITHVSVARGNMVLVDHGRSIFDEQVGSPEGNWKQINCGSRWDEPRWVQERIRFAPVLGLPDMTMERSRENLCAVSNLLDRACLAEPSIRLHGFPAVAVSGKEIPLDAAILDQPKQLIRRIHSWYQRQQSLAFAIEDLLQPDTGSLLNQSFLAKTDKNEKKLNPKEEEQLLNEVPEQLKKIIKWQPRFDLVDSKEEDRHFVVEIDNHRRAHLRFGDNEHGSRPDIGTRFVATYRVGNGVAGNVSAEAINRFVTRDGSGTAIFSVRNPEPANGGIDPETNREAKTKAPYEFRAKQNRAILASDYEQLVMREFGDRLQAARARVSQVGTHWQVNVVIDPLAQVRNFTSLQNEIQTKLFTYRRMQHNVRVMRGIQVPLELRITAILMDGTLKSEIFRELSDLFSSREFAGGIRGQFHPDNLTFGQPVHVSRLTATARMIAGLKNVHIDHLSRLNGQNVARAEGNENASNILEMGPLEIAQLENSGSEQTGKLQIRMEGGK